MSSARSGANAVDAGAAAPLVLVTNSSTSVAMACEREISRTRPICRPVVRLRPLLNSSSCRDRVTTHEPVALRAGAAETKTRSDGPSARRSAAWAAPSARRSGPRSGRSRWAPCEPSSASQVLSSLHPPRVGASQCSGRLQRPRSRPRRRAPAGAGGRSVRVRVRVRVRAVASAVTLSDGAPRGQGSRTSWARRWGRRSGTRCRSRRGRTARAGRR